MWYTIHDMPYREPSYHMNVRGSGVQYMRNNPERFIESSTGLIHNQ